MKRIGIAILLCAVGCGAGTPPDSSTPAKAPADAPKDGEPAPEPTAEAKAEEEVKSLPDRDPALAKRLVEEQSALILDVRSEAEFEEGHVPNAVLIPHDQLADRLAEVAKAQGDDKTKPIVVYCKSGRRAGVAKTILLDAGYTQVTNLGGFVDWPE